MYGKPRNDLRSSSWSRPASRFDSPSRSRSFVWTFRERNDGRACPATFKPLPRALFSISSSRITSSSKVTRGVISTLTPTGRYVNEVRGLKAAPPCATGVKVVDGTGTSSPRFRIIFCPSAPRNCGLATTLVSESVSRNLTAAEGTDR